MKKFTSISFMLIAALMMFASCSKDDDSAPALDLKLIEGEWTLTKTVISWDGEETIGEDSDKVYTFDADKTYSISAFREVEGTYTLNGNKISLTSEDETVVYEIKELTATNMIAVYSEKTEILGESFEYSETIYLSREK